MNDIKYIVAKNITDLRQAQGLTQFELAERLNYSDKAISKWERGGSLPSVTVLLELSNLFGVTLDYLVEPHSDPADISAEFKRTPKYSRGFITAVSILLVWLIATGVYVGTSFFEGLSTYERCMSFAWAVPASMVVWLVLNSIWFNKIRNYLIISLLMWTAMICTHLQLSLFGIDIKIIYILGIPSQLIILFWSAIKKRPRRQHSNNKG